MSPFWKGEKGTIENGKCKLLKMARCHYIIISIKSQKDLEQVSSLQDLVKNMLETSVTQYTNIWPNFILIAFRIQEK